MHKSGALGSDFKPETLVPEDQRGPSPGQMCWTNGRLSRRSLSLHSTSTGQTPEFLIYEVVDDMEAISRWAE